MSKRLNKLMIEMKQLESNAPRFTCPRCLKDTEPRALLTNEGLYIIYKCPHCNARYDSSTGEELKAMR